MLNNRVRHFKSDPDHKNKRDIFFKYCFEFNRQDNYAVNYYLYKK